MNENNPEQDSTVFFKQIISIFFSFLNHEQKQNINRQIFSHFLDSMHLVVSKQYTIISLDKSIEFRSLWNARQSTLIIFLGGAKKFFWNIFPFPIVNLCIENLPIWKKKIRTIKVEQYYFTIRLISIINQEPVFRCTLGYNPTKKKINIP